MAPSASRVVLFLGIGLLAASLQWALQPVPSTLLLSLPLPERDPSLTPAWMSLVWTAGCAVFGIATAIAAAVVIGRPRLLWVAAIGPLLAYVIAVLVGNALAGIAPDQLVGYVPATLTYMVAGGHGAIAYLIALGCLSLATRRARRNVSAP